MTCDTLSLTEAGRTISVSALTRDRSGTLPQTLCTISTSVRVKGGHRGIIGWGGGGWRGAVYGQKHKPPSGTQSPDSNDTDCCGSSCMSSGGFVPLLKFNQVIIISSDSEGSRSGGRGQGVGVRGHGAVLQVVPTQNGSTSVQENHEAGRRAWNTTTTTN